MLAFRGHRTRAVADPSAPCWYSRQPEGTTEAKAVEGCETEGGEEAVSVTRYLAIVVTAAIVTLTIAAVVGVRMEYASGERELFELVRWGALGGLYLLYRTGLFMVVMTMVSVFLLGYAVHRTRRIRRGL
jgi:hypothetical protein